MEPFWKAAALVILTVIFSMTLEKGEKDISTVLTVAGCFIVLIRTLGYLSDVIAFLWKLGSTAGSRNPFMGTLLKITGVALMSEMTALISSDAGNSALGKAMQILGNAAILFLSLPLFDTFFTIIQEMMGMV